VFEIVGSQLRLKAGTGLDFEAQNAFDVTVQVDDATIPGAPDDNTPFTLSISDVNEFDVGVVSDVDPQGNEVREDAGNGAPVNITASAHDADATNNAITYSLVDDAGGRFTIDANSGVVSVVVELDAEVATIHVITVRALSADGSRSEGSFLVHVLDMNDNAPVISRNHLALEEGGMVILTSSNLLSVDADIVTGDLAYEVTGLTHGQFELLSDPGVSVTRFTQQQIDRGQISFIHDGGEFAPSYQVSVSDGLFSAGPMAAVVQFTNANDAPQAGDLSYETGASVVVGNVLLAAEDSDGDSLTASLVAAPANGTVSLDPHGTFSFSPDAGFTGTDTFAYQVSDGLATSNVGIVSIVVKTETAPVPQPPRDENPRDDEGSSSDETTQESTTRSPGEIQSGEASAAPLGLTTHPADQKSGSHESAAPADEVIRLEDVHLEDETLLGFVASIRDVADDRPARHFARAEVTGRDARVRAEESRSSSPLAKDRGRLVHLGETSQLWRDLDEFQQTVGMDLQLQNIAIGSVGTVVSGFTVGYVLWALRSGLLLTSVLASLPAWTLFDPLAIASASGQYDDDREESLEQIIEDRAALARARSNLDTNSEP
jgi:hypothetical protein